MQRLFVLLVFLIFLIGCNGKDAERGNGDIVTMNKNIGEFNEIEITGNFEIVLKETQEPALSITTDQNLHQFIDIEQKGDRLVINATKNLRSDHGVQIEIGYRDINVIESSGASTITSEGILVGDRFTLDLSGAGAVQMELEVDRLKMNISGAGSVEVTGKANIQEVSMSGAGGLDASKLISEEAKVNISGVGGAHVHVTETLDASVSGVGGITYSGNPKEVRKDVSGLGKISAD